MSRLQKKAWSSLITITICSLICLLCFSFMVARNSKGAHYLLICLVAGVPTGIAAMFQELRFQNQLDEREKMLYQNANQWSVGALTGYLLIFCFSVFFLSAERARRRSGCFRECCSADCLLPRQHTRQLFCFNAAGSRTMRETLTNQIRRLRFDNGEMTQQALADKVGVTRQTIIAIEQGNYTPSLTLAMKLARAFNKTVEEVFQLNLS